MSARLACFCYTKGCCTIPGGQLRTRRTVIDHLAADVVAAKSFVRRGHQIPPAIIKACLYNQQLLAEGSDAPAPEQPLLSGLDLGPYLSQLSEAFMEGNQGGNQAEPQDGSMNFFIPFDLAYILTPVQLANMDVDDPPFRDASQEDEDRNDGGEGEGRDDGMEDEDRGDGGEGEGRDEGMEDEDRGDGREDDDRGDGGLDEDFDGGREDEDLQGPMPPTGPELDRQGPNLLNAPGPILGNDGNDSDFTELSVDDPEPPSRPTFQPDPPLPLTLVEKRTLRMLWQMKKTGGTVENYEGFASVFRAEGLEGTDCFNSLD